MWPGLECILPTAISPRFAQQYPDECCPKRKHFLSLSCRASGRHIDESVSLLSLKEIWKISQPKDNDSTHHLFRYVVYRTQVVAFSIYPILNRCGVLCYVYFGWAFQSLFQINERLHTFCFHTNPPYQESDGNKNFVAMIYQGPYRFLVRLLYQQDSWEIWPGFVSLILSPYLRRFLLWGCTCITPWCAINYGLYLTRCLNWF